MNLVTLETTADPLLSNKVMKYYDVGYIPTAPYCIFNTIDIYSWTLVMVSGYATKILSGRILTLSVYSIWYEQRIKLYTRIQISYLSFCPLLSIATVVVVAQLSPSGVISRISDCFLVVLFSLRNLARAGKLTKNHIIFWADKLTKSHIIFDSISSLCPVNSQQ